MGKTWSLGLGLVLSGGLLADEWQMGQFHVLTDYLYLQRSHVQNEPLAVDTAVSGCHGGCKTNRVLSTTNLVEGYEPGIRVSMAYIPDEKSAYELVGLYLWEMDNTDTRYAKGVLSVPFDNPNFATSYFDVDKVSANYRSLFYTGELNYWRTFSAARNSYLALSGVFGLRFANISEHFSLKAYKHLSHSSYDISAKNDLIGLQVGFDFQIHPTRRFYWDLSAKVGLDLNRISSKVYLGNLNNQETLRNYSKQTVQGGVFADVFAGAGCQLLEWLNVHIGYEAFFFGGLALAPDQIDYSSDELQPFVKLSSYDISKDGYVLIHGIYAGLIFSF